MKYLSKIGIFIVSFIVIAWFSNAYAISDPVNIVTRIDCSEGDDAKARPFDATLPPYLTLKKGIEDSIKYLNDNNYTAASNTWVSSFTYTIKVRGGCNFGAQDGNSISLDFVGSSNDSTLEIMGDGGNFSISNKSFSLARPEVWNIHFINASFLKNDVTGYYFSGYNFPTAYYCYGPSWYTGNGSGIRIEKSLINVNPGTQFAYHYDQYMCANWAYYHLWAFEIENSQINLAINGSYPFYAPVIVKDSKIKIRNANTDGNKYDVGFYIGGDSRDGYAYGSTSFISNEIDMNGNNFLTNNWGSVFLNNKIFNVWNFVPGTDFTNNKSNVFVNNTVSCNNNVDISKNDIAYNNLFSNWFTDTNDFDNFKRNFTGSTTSELGVGWVYRKVTGGPLKINMDYESLYRAVHNESLPHVDNPVYFLIQ